LVGPQPGACGTWRPQRRGITSRGDPATAGYAGQPAGQATTPQGALLADTSTQVRRVVEGFYLSRAIIVVKRGRSLTLRSQRAIGVCMPGVL
jgi:hypothetical protein